jgi:hypothetical protein
LISGKIFAKRPLPPARPNSFPVRTTRQQAEWGIGATWGSRAGYPGVPLHVTPAPRRSLAAHSSAISLARETVGQTPAPVMLW